MLSTVKQRVRRYDEQAGLSVEKADRPRSSRSSWGKGARCLFILRSKWTFLNISGGLGDPCLLREGPVLPGVGGAPGSDHKGPLWTDRLKDTTENITLPQLRWRAVNNVCSYQMQIEVSMYSSVQMIQLYDFQQFNLQIDWQTSVPIIQGYQRRIVPLFWPEQSA